MPTPDNLARPKFPQASRHAGPVRMRYTLRQDCTGFWWLIPAIYEYAWDQYSKEWEKQNVRKFFASKTFEAPVWATRVGDLSNLTFEMPVEV